VKESDSPAARRAGPKRVDPKRSQMSLRLQAALAGTVVVAPGVDLTEPTGEEWDAESDSR
jgi:hypothetical protein